MYLAKLEAGPQSHRKLRDAIRWHYKDVDVKKIRDELEEEGLIEFSHKEKRTFGKETKDVPFYKLRGVQLNVQEKKKYDPWDITLPSSIFTKQEKANMMSTLRLLEMRSNEKLQKLADINVYGKA
jgi:hypothetical protein